MIFKEIQEIINNMIDEIDYDEQVDIIIKSALNQAYSKLCKEDKRLNRAFIPIIDGVATLPSNLLSIVESTPKLDGIDKVVGNKIITDKTGMLDIKYNYIRKKLVNDEDKIDLHDILQDAMISFACAKYYKHRKKIDIASMYMQDFNESLSMFIDMRENLDSGCIDRIVDVYVRGGEEQ